MTRNERRRIRYKERRAGAPVRYRWDHAKDAPLTPEQMQVIELLMQDKSPKEAAVILKLKNENAAENRLKRARIAMGVNTTYGLLAKLFRRDLNRVIASLYLLLIAATAGASDHWVLVQTNLAQALGPAVALRSFVEPEVVTLVSTNTVDVPWMVAANTQRIYHISMIVTNRTLKFTFEGKDYIQHVSTEPGPKISETFTDIPAPLPGNGQTNLQLRRR